MIKYAWYVRIKPVGLAIRTVSVFAFDPCGRVALWRHDGGYGLPGGHVEDRDGDIWEATARREAREEISIDLDDVRYLGFQTVRRGKEQFGQVRMVARIGAIHPLLPDPDGGITRERLAVPHSQILDRLGWHDDRARTQIADAVQAAHGWWGFKSDQTTQAVALDTEPSVHRGTTAW